MPVVSFEDCLAVCRPVPGPCSAVGCWRCPRCSPGFWAALCSLQCSCGSTEPSARLARAACGAETAKGGFICPAAISQAVSGHSWINLGVTAIRTVSSVGFSDLRHALECRYKNKYRHEMVPPNHTFSYCAINGSCLSSFRDLEV